MCLLACACGLLREYSLTNEGRRVLVRGEGTMPGLKRALPTGTRGTAVRVLVTVTYEWGKGLGAQRFVVGLELYDDGGRQGFCAVFVSPVSGSKSREVLHS